MFDFMKNSRGKTLVKRLRPQWRAVVQHNVMQRPEAPTFEDMEIYLEDRASLKDNVDESSVHLEHPS